MCKDYFIFHKEYSENKISIVIKKNIAVIFEKNTKIFHKNIFFITLAKNLKKLSL